ncbi:MAG: hypothetical protein MJ137_07150, partial [Clostridia bacterium]|nr:hypothetical protein [Clostridia bacterium]
MSYIDNTRCIAEIYKDGIAIASTESALSYDSAAEVSLKSLPFEDGEAVFISAFSGTGLDGANAAEIRISIPAIAKILAIVRHSPFWCRPAFCGSTAAVPDNTQALLIKRADDAYDCIVPLVGDTYKSVISGGDDGVRVRVFSGVDGIGVIDSHPAFVRTTASSPMDAVNSAARRISRLLPNCRLRSERKMPEVSERLGWCSWDALHIFVNKRELLEKAAEFAEKKVPVGYAIIDDMWADCTLIDVFPRELECDETMIPTMHKARMRDFSGDPLRFPDGMADAISALKAAGIPNVGIWFPTTGYWYGLEPSGPLAEEFRDRLINGAGDRLIIKPESDAADSWFAFLCARVRSWGGDFVKIDNQGFHRYYSGICPVGKSAAVIQQAIDKAVFGYFDGALINCMGMPNECMFNRPESAVSRCSDDFQPENAEWFTKNILQCSFNGLLQGRFFVNDWDMWWTDDGQAVKNGLCRAISGGPVYLSDKIGRTRPEILAPIILKDGRLLRCDESAAPTPDSLFDDPRSSGRPFKIRNTIKGCGLVACFNLDAGNAPVTGRISPSDALLTGTEFICREFFSGETVKLRAGEAIEFRLVSRDDIKLYSFCPAGGCDVVPLGRTDLYTGVGAVSAFADGRLTLAEGGRIAFYSEKKLKITAEGLEISSERKGNVYTADVP